MPFKSSPLGKEEVRDFWRNKKPKDSQLDSQPTMTARSWAEPRHGLNNASEVENALSKGATIKN